jgi:hypothetical protein
MPINRARQMARRWIFIMIASEFRINDPRVAASCIDYFCNDFYYLRMRPDGKKELTHLLHGGIFLRSACARPAATSQQQSPIVYGVLLQYTTTIGR